MLDLVKYRWMNGHGAWIGPEWMSIPSDAGHERANYPRTTATVLEYASGGKGTVKGIEIIERLHLPEDIRVTGKSSLLLSYTILYDKGREMDGDQLVARLYERMDMPNFGKPDPQ